MTIHDCPVMREKSPLRGNKARGRMSPAPVENVDETSQENKRTTRSARSKDAKGTFKQLFRKSVVQSSLRGSKSFG